MSSSSATTKPSSKKASAKAPAAAQEPAATTTTTLSRETIDDTSSEEDASDDESDIDEEMPDVSKVLRAEAGGNGSGSGSGGRRGEKEYSAYRPPAGFAPVPVHTSIASSPFEWDQMAKRQGVELWAVRVPQNLKPSRLTSLAINVSPSTTTSDPTTHRTISGSLKTSHNTYTLRPAFIPSNAASSSDKVDKDAAAADGQNNVVGGGEEMKGLRLVVPRVGKGGLFVAPKPITQHLILTPDLPVPTPPTTEENPFAVFTSTAPTPTSSDPTQKHKRPQPAGVLKYRNVPFGSGKVVKDLGLETVQPVTIVEGGETVVAASQPEQEQEGASQEKVKKEKKSKRKSEGGGEKEKKSKRVKA